MSTNPPTDPVYKTGMRVPVDGVYEDQHGTRSFHAAHRTFPPCIDHKGEAAFRRLISVTGYEAA
jgi:hypothetical protein